MYQKEYKVYEVGKDDKMKHQKNIKELIQKAKKEGTAKTGKYECIIKDNKVILKHYGTVILEIDNNKVISKGGAYSASDRIAINNALYELNIDYCQARIKEGTLNIIDNENNILF